VPSSGSSVSFSPLRETDSGVYTCEASIRTPLGTVNRGSGNNVVITVVGRSQSMHEC
jgi:hypothetical protein